MHSIHDVITSNIFMAIALRHHDHVVGNDTITVTYLQFGAVGSDVGQINEVNLRRARFARDRFVTSLQQVCLM